MSARNYDIVIANGRVIDPETGLDAIRHVGVQGSTVKAVSEKPLAGKTVIPASGLVVSPGFIDLNCRTQSIPGDRIKAFDGVTTVLELACGTLPAGLWYIAQAQSGRAINYGAGVAWDLPFYAEMNPGDAITSDAVPWITPNDSVLVNAVRAIPDNAIVHPHTAGTFAHFISNFVNKHKKISLISAIKKCSLIPAQILEKSTPSMKRKGRLQVGADADVIVFDLEKFEDRATFEKPNTPPTGVQHVLVNGVQLICDGQLDIMALPGRPVVRSIL